MRFSLTITAELDASRFEEKAGVSKMSEWSNKLSERLKTQKTAKENTDSVFLERQRLIKTYGPSLWQDVITETKAHCDDLNRDMGEQVATIDSAPGRWLNVNGKTPNGVRQMVADFDADKSLLHWRAEANSRKYEVSIGSDGKAAFYPLGDNGERLFAPPSTAKNIAQEMLDALFFGLFS